MKIRWKIVLIVLVTGVATSLSVFFISRNVILGSYKSIEDLEVSRNLGRAKDALGNEIGRLVISTKDWSQWDDLYFFAEKRQPNPDPDFIESNLKIVAFVNLDVNTMVFVDTEGNIFFSKFVDIENEVELDSREINAAIIARRNLWDLDGIDDSMQGIIMLDQKPFLVASQQIRKSNNDGSEQGTLLLGRFLDEGIVKKINDLTHLSIEVYSYDSPSLPDDFSIAKQELTGDEEIFINPLSADRVAGYSLLRDVDGGPILIMRVDFPRETYGQGEFTLRFFLIILAVIGIIFSLFLILLLEKYIVSRITRFHKEVENVSASKNLSIKVTEGANDEIGELANSVNYLLSEINSAQKIEAEAVIRATDAGKALQDRVDEVERMNKFMIGRELKMVELKKEISDLKKRVV